jgi:hypothetical protein
MPDRLADKERSEALAQMHLIKILRAYMLHMVGEVPGYKALVLDKDTMRISSTQFGRTELAEYNVVHIERLDSNDSKEHLELKASNSRSSVARPSTAQQQPQQQNPLSMATLAAAKDLFTHSSGKSTVANNSC